MPTKPTTTYTWDTNQTNSSQPASSLRTDGYVTDAIPTSANVNYQLNSIYQWLFYLEAVTDALATLSSTTDISNTIDSDNNSSSNKWILYHDSAVELAQINESANFILTDASSHTITIGNDAITNANSDGTLTISSQKHITMDIDSDNDGTDGVWKVRANGSTNAFTVTESGNGTFTGTITATNLTALDVSRALMQLTNIVPYTSAQVTTMVTDVHGGLLYTTTPSYVVIGTANDIVEGGVDTNVVPQAASTWTSRSAAVNFLGIASNSPTSPSFFGAVAAAGALYTSTGTAVTWTSRTSGTANSLGYIAGNANNWVAAGDGANNTLIGTGSDPTTGWTARTSGLDGTTTFRGLAWNSSAGLFAAITTDNEIITSPTGVTWTSRTNPTTGSWFDIVVSGNIFFAYGQDGKIIYSSDGITWTNVSIAAVPTGEIAGVAVVTASAGSTFWIAACEGNQHSNSLFYSTDSGANWTKFLFETSFIGLQSGSGNKVVFHYDENTKRLLFANTNNDLAFSYTVR